MKKKIVYVGLAADILHEGHINILHQASKLGKVIVGLLTDQAISTYKKIPLLDYSQREIVLKNLKLVSKVVPQKKLDYVDNLNQIRPDYVVHGDDWKKGVQKKTRERVIKTLKKWNGKLIEPKYTKNISSSLIKSKIYKQGISPQNRVSRLKRLMDVKKIVRVIESHNALTGLIIEEMHIIQKNVRKEFDAMWSSSLTDSLTKGKPDNQSVDYSSRINGINDIMDVTTKPIIFDADNGGRIEHLSYLVKTLERLGVSAIVLEDKIGEKKNSLFLDQKNNKQDTVKNFCKKIKIATEAKISSDLMVVARVESFILGKGLKDALLRAEKYSKAGADAILIHSKLKNPSEIFEFSKKFNKSKFSKPLIAVPSTYSKTTEKLLEKNGFKIVIYANQFLRSAYPAMVNVGKKILKNERAYDVENKITPINEIINLIK